ncbi:hypothetical protein [Sphingobium sp.]|uniref:hypothetical protein n=1 Tax=Sphingobium sp. TaxID=1912891 RepID=UPI003B3B5671
MIGGINNGLTWNNGIGNGLGQIKKAWEEAAAQASAPAAQTPPPAQPVVTPAPEPTASTPAPSAPVSSAPSQSVIISTPAPSEPLTYAAPSSGPRQMSATPATATPVRQSLSERLADSSYYASPQASAVADPVASAQREKDGAALSQAQIIAQAAYGIVARAGVDDRLSLIQNG